VQRAKFPIVGFVKDPAGVAGAASRQAGEEGLRLCRKVGTGFNRKSSMEIRKMRS
jgi:bifunctional non-homologous end joining protein LigD